MFKNKIILVTGGSKGIGYTVAQEFLKQGAIVYINSRSNKKIKKAKKKLQLISKNIKCLVGDLSKEKIVRLRERNRQIKISKKKGIYNPYIKLTAQDF